jgi:anti-anti-sigma factor
VTGNASQTAKGDGVKTPELAITVDEPGCLLTLNGRLSALTVAEVRTALITAIACGAGDVVVDISEVELVDASGLGVLVGAHRLAVRGERRLVLRNVPDRIERLLAITHLNRVLTLEHVLTLDASAAP